MEPEVGQSAELFLANVAPMRFLSRVHHAVVVQGRELHETLVANVTFVLPFAGVHPQMDLEIPQLAARHVANVATVN